MTFDAESRIAILDELLEATLGMLEAARAAERQNRDEANEAEGAMVSRYDTFKEEAQYLQAGHQLRVLELERGLGALRALRQQLERGGRPGERAVAGAFVLVEGPDGEGRWYFLAPFGGGRVCEIAGRDVAVVSPQTPVGRAVIGAEAGDVVEVVDAAGTLEHELLEIA